MFSGFRKVRKVPKIAELGGGRIRHPSLEEIPFARRVPVGRVKDRLEAAAVQSEVGTLPERIVWKWLLDNDYQFSYQLAELGGRDVLGGAVIDFVIHGLGDRPIIVRVQGQYWHGPSFPQRQRRDDEQFFRLHAMGYAVCDLWENDIYKAVEDGRLDSYIEEELYACL